MIAVPALFALFAIVLSAWRPKLFLGLTLVIVVSAKTLDHWALDATSAFDEIAVGVAVSVGILHRLSSGRRIRWLPGLGWFAGFALLGVVSALVQEVPTDVWVAGAVLALKGIILGVAFAQEDWKARDIEAGCRAGAAVMWIILTFVLLNALSPAGWASAFAASGRVDVRYGLPSLVGPFVHPGDLGAVLALGALGIAAYRLTIRKSAASAVLMILAGLGAAASLRTKTLAGLALGFTWVATRRASRGIGILLVLVAVPIATVLLFEQIVELVSSMQTRLVVSASTDPRVVMSTGAIVVGATHFPLGAGFGRFGSFVAASSYSPEYLNLGFPQIWGLQPSSVGNGDYLLDTQWPAIVAEPGFIGGVLYAIALVRIVLSARVAYSASNRWTRFAGALVIVWMIQTVVDSVAAPSLVSPPTYAFVFAAAGVAASMLRPEGAAIPEPIRGRRNRRAIT